MMVSDSRGESESVVDLVHRQADIVVSPLGALVCAKPTTKYPAGRTGTSAGYQAHRDVGETSCQPCVSTFSAKSLARRRTLSEDELARYRVANAQATRKRREIDPEKVRAEKRKRMDANRAIIRQAKAVPCTDCGVQYPPHVMQFDHLDPTQKHFNVGERGPTLGEARLLAEIAKCEVVCANCHAERTYQRMQARKGA
jgi:hypothetical protein